MVWTIQNQRHTPWTTSDQIFESKLSRNSAQRGVSRWGTHLAFGHPSTYMHAAQCIALYSLHTCTMLHSLSRVGRWMNEVNVYPIQIIDLELCCRSCAAGFQMLDKCSEKYCTGSASYVAEIGVARWKNVGLRRSECIKRFLTVFRKRNLVRWSLISSEKWLTIKNCNTKEGRFMCLRAMGYQQAQNHYKIHKDFFCTQHMKSVACIL